MEGCQLPVRTRVPNGLITASQHREQGRGHGGCGAAGPFLQPHTPPCCCRERKPWRFLLCNAAEAAGPGGKREERPAGPLLQQAPGALHAHVPLQAPVAFRTPLEWRKERLRPYGEGAARQYRTAGPDRAPLLPSEAPPETHARSFAHGLKHHHSPSLGELSTLPTGLQDSHRQ